MIEIVAMLVMLATLVLIVGYVRSAELHSGFKDYLKHRERLALIRAGQVPEDLVEAWREANELTEG